MPDLDREELFWSKVDTSGECWIWLGARTADGYGRFWIGGGTQIMAHRYLYETVAGPVPEGLQMDHLCRNPPCVNPAHLELVTSRENTLRGLNGRMVVRCKHGHDYTPENTRIDTKGRRNCRECHRIKNRPRWRTKAAPDG